MLKNSQSTCSIMHFLLQEESREGASGCPPLPGGSPQRGARSSEPRPWAGAGLPSVPPRPGFSGGWGPRSPQVTGEETEAIGPCPHPQSLLKKKRLTFFSIPSKNSLLEYSRLTTLCVSGAATQSHTRAYLFLRFFPYRPLQSTEWAPRAAQ